MNEVISVKPPTDYTKYVNLEDMMFLRQDVTMQDFLQDARIITMAEAKQLRRMYGSLGRAGWGILKKGLDSGFRDMNKLEKEVYLKLGNTAFKGLPPEDIKSIIEDSCEGLEIFPHDLKHITRREKQRPMRKFTKNALCVGAGVGAAALWVGSDLIDDKNEDGTCKLSLTWARFGMKVTSVALTASAVLYRVYNSD